MDIESEKREKPRILSESLTWMVVRLPEEHGRNMLGVVEWGVMA